MRPDLYAFLLDAAYQDWCRWRSEYFGLGGLAPNVSAAQLRQLDVIVVKMDRCMRDYMLVAEQRSEFGATATANDAMASLQRPALTLVEPSGSPPGPAAARPNN